MNKNPIIALLIVIIIILSYIAFKDKIPAQPVDTSPFEQILIKDDSKIKHPVPIVENENQTKLYLEKETDSTKFLTGGMASPFRIMATSDIDATVTYTIKTNSAPVVPNPKVTESIETKTVVITKGTNQIGTTYSIDNPIITYTVK